MTHTPVSLSPGLVVVELHHTNVRTYIHRCYGIGHFFFFVTSPACESSGWLLGAAFGETGVGAAGTEEGPVLVSGGGANGRRAIHS